MKRKKTHTHTQMINNNEYVRIPAADNDKCRMRRPPALRYDI